MKLCNIITAGIVLFSFSYCKTILADLTRDGVKDSVYIDTNTVVVIDGQSGKSISIVESDVEQVLTWYIDDFHPDFSGPEIAVVWQMRGDPGNVVTCIYSYDDHGYMFDYVSDGLAGHPLTDDNGEMIDAKWFQVEDQMLYPIMVHEIRRKITRLSPSEEKYEVIYIDPSKKEEYLIETPPLSCTILEGWLIDNGTLHVSVGSGDHVLIERQCNENEPFRYKIINQKVDQESKVYLHCANEEKYLDKRFLVMTYCYKDYFK